MNAANVEFKGLFERSGWKSQTEAARRLFLKPASVSRYLSGKDKPSPQTLELFRIKVDNQRPAAEPLALRDVPPHHVDDMLHAVAELREKFLAVERCAQRLAPNSRADRLVAELKAVVVKSSHTSAAAREPHGAPEPAPERTKARTDTTKPGPR